MGRKIKLIRSKVSDGDSLLKKHTLYESGHVCICNCVPPPLISAFVYLLSAGEKDKMLMNSLFRQIRK